MSFISLQYLIFLPAVTALFFILPHRARWSLLLAAGYAFYFKGRPDQLLCIAAATAATYTAALLLDARRGQPAAKGILAAAIIFDVGLLFALKYLGFFAASAQYALALAGTAWAPPKVDAALPIGISFYTLQAVGYLADVYAGRRVAEKRLGRFALFVCFFPILASGPIERAGRLLPQFDRETAFDPERIFGGVRLIAWGVFKKLVLADKFAVFTDAVFNNPRAFTGLPLILAAYFFTLQIYFDFSSYTDIARGSARLLGFDVMENFRTPYLARSMTEFWRRWHISLSTWFRDYLYIPLGGNRVSAARRYFNLMVVFIVSGLWHGANWTFVAWGAIHGVFAVVSTALASRRPAPASAAAGLLRAAVTFHLAAFAWIFFRANSISDALYIVGHLFSGLRLQAGFGVDFGLERLAVVAVFTVAVEVVQSLRDTGRLDDVFFRRPAAVRWAVYYALLFFLLTFAESGAREFIYFRF